MSTKSYPETEKQRQPYQGVDMASASEIFNFVLPSGKTVDETLVNLHDLILSHGLDVGNPLVVTQLGQSVAHIVQQFSTSPIMVSRS